MRQVSEEDTIRHPEVYPYQEELLQPTAVHMEEQPSVQVSNWLKMNLLTSQSLEAKSSHTGAMVVFLNLTIRMRCSWKVLVSVAVENIKPNTKKMEHWVK